MLKIVCIVFIGLAHLLILIAILSSSSREPFTQFPTDILKQLYVGNVEDDGDDGDYIKERVDIPKIGKRQTACKVCKVYKPPDIIRADKIVPTVSDTIHLQSPLNVNGILDVKTLKLNNYAILRYDDKNDSFVFG